MTWLQTLVGKITVGALALLIAYGVGHLVGSQRAEARCDRASLEAEVARLKRDLAVSELSSRFWWAMATVANQREQERTQKVQAYEAELAKRPDADCRLDDGDLRRLRDIRGTAPAGPPPGRPGAGVPAR